MSRAGDVLLAHLTGEAATLLDAADALRTGEGDAAHRMRVAARRMRSAVRTCAPLVDAEDAASLCDALRALADALSGERDNEVLLDRVTSTIDELPSHPGRDAARTAARRGLGSALAAGHTAALATLDSPSYTALAERLRRPDLGLRLTAQADTKAAKTIPELVRAALVRLDRRVGRLPLEAAAEPYGVPAPLSGDDDEQWHRARIAAKRARYAADLAVPVAGKPAKRLAGALRDVTETLGAHQDAALAAACARTLAHHRDTPATAAFVLGEVYVRERFAVAAARRSFTVVWPRVAGADWPERAHG